MTTWLFMVLPTELSILKLWAVNCWFWTITNIMKRTAWKIPVAQLRINTSVGLELMLRGAHMTDAAHCAATKPTKHISIYLTLWFFNILKGYSLWFIFPRQFILEYFLQSRTAYIEKHKDRVIVMISYNLCNNNIWIHYRNTHIGSEWPRYGYVFDMCTNKWLMSYYVKLQTIQRFSVAGKQSCWHIFTTSCKMALFTPANKIDHVKIHFKQDLRPLGRATYATSNMALQPFTWNASQNTTDSKHQKHDCNIKWKTNWPKVVWSWWPCARQEAGRMM